MIYNSHTACDVIRLDTVIFFLVFRENGEFEEVLVLPSHSRLSPPEGEEEQQQQQEDNRVPVLAFSENGLLKPLSRVDDISAQQGAGEKASTL